MTSPGTVLRTNLFPGPLPGDSNQIQWWGAYAVAGTTTLTPQATGGPTGGGYARLAYSAANGGNTGVYVETDASAVTPGGAYTASLWVRSSVAVTVPLAIEWHANPSAGEARGLNLSSTTAAGVAVAAGVWTRLSVTGTCPAGAGQVVLTVYCAAGQTSGATVDTTMALLEAGSTLGSYFDGNTPTTATDYYSWSGYPGFSTSLDSVASAPTASFTTGTTSGVAPLRVDVSDTSTGHPTGWSWDFGNGKTASTRTASVTYTAAGTYTVTLTASNLTGSSTATSTVTVAPPPVAAAFTATPSIGPAPLAVQFTDTTRGGATSWAWTFGDGGTSTAQNPTYSYPVAGNYQVTLTATGPGGSSVAGLTVAATSTAAPTGGGAAGPVVVPQPVAARGPSVGLLAEWSQPQTSWTYVFTDALTDTELAVLPMVGVTFEKVLNGTGKLTGYVPTGDPAVRKLNPWVATVPRRTSLYVYYGDTLIWGGMVWQSEVVSGFAGIKIMAATFESWLVTQFLLADISFTGQTAVQMFTQALAQVQAVPGANMNIAVVDGSPPGQVEIIRPNTTWRRVDLKDPLNLLGMFLNTQVPLEWRIDLAPQAGGRVVKQLMIGEPRLGRTTNVSGLYAWHDHEDPASTLLTFNDLDDGLVQANAATGSIPDPAGTNQLTQRLFSYHDSKELGSDEVGAGYPRMMRAVSTLDRGVITQNDLDDAILGAVADSMSQGKQMTSFGLRIDAPDVRTYDVGDDMDLSITHPGYTQWPAPVARQVRILGRKITPRGPRISAATGDPWAGNVSAATAGSSYGDKVELTVFDSSSPRLPRSTTLVAHLRDLIRRVKSLEVR